MAATIVIALAVFLYMTGVIAHLAREHKREVDAAYDRGRAEGYADGHKAGLREGRCQGWNETKKAWQHMASRADSAAKEVKRLTGRMQAVSTENERLRGEALGVVVGRPTQPSRFDTTLCGAAVPPDVAELKKAQ